MTKRIVPVHLAHCPVKRHAGHSGGFTHREPARSVYCPREAEIAASDVGVELRGPVKNVPGWWRIRLSQQDAEELALIGYIEISGNTYWLYTA